MGIFSPPYRPKLRWMQFIDGENLAIRASQFLRSRGLELLRGERFEPSVLMWTRSHPEQSMGEVPMNCETLAFRSMYYTSAIGNDERLLKIRKQIRWLGFEPHVFSRRKGEAKAKGVDIALTRDMLSHAFFGNYEAAVLFSGDGDYVPVVEEVKRLGKRVYVYAFREGLSTDLELAADKFVDIGPKVLELQNSDQVKPIEQDDPGNAPLCRRCELLAHHRSSMECIKALQVELERYKKTLVESEIPLDNSSVQVDNREARGLDE